MNKTQTKEINHILPYVLASIIRHLNCLYDIAVKDGDLVYAESILDRKARLLLQLVMLEG